MASTAWDRRPVPGRRNQFDNRERRNFHIVYKMLRDEGVRTGLAHARQSGKCLGRPATAAMHTRYTNNLLVQKIGQATASQAIAAPEVEVFRSSPR
jgi:hypothetical protein